MSKITLVTGGSRSGKSKFAEDLLKDEDNVLYIATSIVTDGEMAERIEKHRVRRNRNWDTYEGYKDLGEALLDSDKGYIMLDCVTIMLTNLMFDENRDFDSMTREQLEALQGTIEVEFKQLVNAARNSDRNLVMVTNEVGYGLVPEYKLGRIFRDLAGSINQMLAELSDEVYLVACGLPLRLKG